MNDEINAVLKQPDVAAKLAAQGIEVRTGTPQSAQQFIENQIDVWAKGWCARTASSRTPEAGRPRAGAGTGFSVQPRRA
jgi:hypothetical protein